MTLILNPFLRGFYNIEIQRVVIIHCEGDNSLLYRSLHSSQTHLPDEQLKNQPCVFNDRVTLINKKGESITELDRLCYGTGIVQSVVYSLYGNDGHNSIHIGDLGSLDAAHNIVHLLNFETGFYSRCWEISTAHIPPVAFDYLCSLADQALPTELLFEAFRIPCSPAVGIKLIATPWSDSNLLDTINKRYEQLREEQRDSDVPEALITLLHQAAMADVRFLIFDADAPTLEGLAIYEES